jgi:hypothetical protein
MENQLTGQEGVHELPTLKEIEALFKKLTLGQKYLGEPTIKMDGEVLKYYEVELPLPNGGVVIYNYKVPDYDPTLPDLPNSARVSASIHVVAFETVGDTIPLYQHTVANYIEGRWVYDEVSGN